MGAPKQKWTSEEEAALKAGISKHGAGKWRTILKDPEFSDILKLRSNVDLKDKWRNMNVMAHGFGSRDRARLAQKRIPQTPKTDANPMALSTVVESDEEIVNAKPLAISTGTSPSSASRKPVTRLDNLILEAITSLKEPTGSNKTSIATYIEGQYWTPLDFKMSLSEKLKSLTRSGKLVKVKRKYRIAPTPSSLPVPLLLEERQTDSPKVEKKKDLKIFTRAQVDADLAKMRNMTAHEAAVAAAQAVAEAEAAMVEAEAAAREAEAAEAEAEAAQAFAEAATKALLKERFLGNWCRGKVSGSSNVNHVY